MTLVGLPSLHDAGVCCLSQGGLVVSGVEVHSCKHPSGGFPRRPPQLCTIIFGKIVRLMVTDKSE